MSANLTEFDRRLLEQAQRRVPLVPRPYEALAAMLGADEDAVLERVAALRGGDAPVIREIAGVFEGSSLGYASALVACRVPPEGLDAAGRCVAEHPGVSHAYGREGPLNLWYTLTLGPDARLDLDATARRLADAVGAEVCHVLPTLERYKIGVHVDAQGRMASAPGTPPAPPCRPLDEDETRAVAALQADLPAQREPFAPLAAQVDLPVERLLALAAALLDGGVMRRYGAMLHHRRAGLEANVLVAWNAADAFAPAAGRLAAERPAISHCYLRPRAPGWPYNLYTMIHGRTRQDCALVVDELHAVTGMTDHVMLWTAREYKKQKVRYFSGDVAAWERRQDTRG